MKLRVGYREMTLEPMAPEISEAKGAVGLFYEAEGRILVSLRQATEEIADTAIHEVLHALIFERDLGPTLGDREEPVVRALAHALTAFARDNPDFVREWLAACAGRRPTKMFKP